MDTTPNKHLEVLPITGDAYAIEQRGLEIESLGQQMTAAADILDKVSLGAECRGKSLDSLQDSADDVKDDLRKAGERYTPSGTVLVAYGRALDTTQTALVPILSDLDDLWTAYEGAKGQFDTDSQLPPPKEGEPDDGRTTQGDVDAKYDAWKARAVDYEKAYDTWWDAYEAAYHGVKDANDDGVHDSWLDNALPALEVLGRILSYAGLVLAVAACIVGGPFILAAALVGLAALAVTVAKYSRGRGTAWDIAFAAIGVFPFGKAFSLAKGLRAAPELSTLVRGLGEMGGDVVGAGWRNGTKLEGLIREGNLGRVLHGSGELNRNGTRVMRNFFRGLDSPSVLTRLVRGQEGAWSEVVSRSTRGLSNAARNNLTHFLDGNPTGRIMQDMLDGSHLPLDFLDNLGKAGAGFGYDRATGGWAVA